MAVLGLRFCARAFSSWGKGGPLFITVRGPLIIAASLVAEHRLQTCRLSNCGPRAQSLRGMWDLPRPGLKPVSLHWQADSQPLRHQGSPRLFFLYKFIYLFLAALGLRCCTWAFSSCGERELLFVAVRGLLIAVASLVAEHGL